MSKLTFWRNHKKKIGAHLVFWPIIAVFVIWGFERFGNPAGGAAATVNGQAITVPEYRRALQRMIDMYSQFSRESIDEEAMKRYHIREGAIQQLINSELLAQAGEKLGVGVSDKEVAETITEMPYLKKDGVFSKDLYENILKNNNLTPNQFESGLRKEMLLEKTRGLFEKNFPAGPLAQEKLHQLQSKKVELEFVKIDPAEVAKTLPVSEAEVADFLKKSGSEQKMKEYYELQKRDYVQDEQVKASHILIKAKKGDVKEEKAAMAKIKDIQKSLKSKPFAELAKKYSDDPGSKVKGGELGWFEKGRMVPEFEKAAFSGKVGEVSAPIQTAFGFHLIKIEDKKAAKTVSFEDAKTAIAKRLVAQAKAEKLMNDISSLDAREAFDKLRTVDKNAKWESTGVFSMADEYIPKIGGDEDLSRDLMSLDEAHPSAKKVYKVGSLEYLVRFKKSIVDEKPAPIVDAEAQGFGKAAFTQWANHLSENAKITINHQLFSSEGVDTSGAADM